MSRYIALLRGVNISGRNRIAMPALASAMAELGLSHVRTHLNSGNIAFSADEADEIALAGQIRGMILTHFGLNIPVLVMPQSRLEATLAQSPSWWGTDDPAIYDNLIFPLPPAGVETISREIGQPTPGLEQVCSRSGVIFWSFDRVNYAKANWWKKTAAPGIGDQLTIRTANTLRKLVRL